jgi:hypothetical protein
VVAKVAVYRRRYGQLSAGVDTEIAIEPRRFSLGDGLILMVAVAVSLERFRALHWFESFPQTIVWFWQVIGQLAGLVYWQYGWGLTRQQVQSQLLGRGIIELLRACCPVLLGLTVAQPLLRLKRPRPPLERVVRQSGFVTCLVGITLVDLLLPMGDLWFSGFALKLPLTRVMILFMLWPLLALAPWRSEASWVDRLGRMVGWGWIAAMIGGVVLEWLGQL